MKCLVEFVQEGRAVHIVAESQSFLPPDALELEFVSAEILLPQVSHPFRFMPVFDLHVLGVMFL
jgi:hypothetical protein